MVPALLVQLLEAVVECSAAAAAPQLLLAIPLMAPTPPAHPLGVAAEAEAVGAVEEAVEAVALVLLVLERVVQTLPPGPPPSAAAVCTLLPAAISPRECLAHWQWPGA